MSMERYLINLKIKSWLLVVMGHEAGDHLRGGLTFINGCCYQGV